MFIFDFCFYLWGYKIYKWFDFDVIYFIVKFKFFLCFCYVDEFRIESVMLDSYCFGDYNNGF